MHRKCNITIQIEAFLDHVLARRIVRQGKELGCLYLKDYSAGQSLSATTSLTVEEAIYHITKGLLPAYSHDPLWKTVETELLYASTEGLLFSLYFQRYYGVTCIIVTPLGELWYSDNDSRGDRGYIDWERYMLFMFALCKDFVIVSIETYDSSYQD